MVAVLDYADMLPRLGAGRKFLLLGNGFSIGCDPKFSYPSLYRAALDGGLSGRAQQVFERLGTNNFEGVMRLLMDTHWVANQYGLSNSDRILDDIDIVKKTLVRAIANSHLEHPGTIEEERMQAAQEFLQPYHGIFTTNYDLLLYWVNMYGYAAEDEVNDETRYQDGFRSDPDNPDAETLVFARRLGSARGLYFLHGALHLFLDGQYLRKHCWSRTGIPLTTLVRDGLNLEQYPLFIAEGTPEKKLEQIQRVGYLWYCLQKLSEIRSPLVVFGHSLGPSDKHLVDRLAYNGGLKTLCIGLHGDPESPENEEIQARISEIQRMRREFGGGRRALPELEVFYFHSESAHVWG